ncbi:DciA family protein [Cupriavidus basilensis]|uniref:DciA family protein n=1 Tax=Cupriavidus basilensis TaxID=68895 RepID=UPI0005BD4A1E|nr:DciA family protein [Cupriavidus basilensis]
MRMFTHYALQTPAAKPLNDWLDKAGPVSALMQTARELAVLEAEVLSLLPRGLQDGIAVAGVKQDARGIGQGQSERTLLLLAAHGAAAARVRQVVPTLLSRLQQRGSQITAIRVRVQPEVGRQGDWDTGPVVKPKVARMSATGLSSLTQLAQELPASPLRDALNTLLSHHR